MVGRNDTVDKLGHLLDVPIEAILMGRPKVNRPSTVDEHVMGRTIRVLRCLPTRRWAWTRWLNSCGRNGRPRGRDTVHIYIGRLHKLLGGA
jgi:hypothetical protein